MNQFISRTSNIVVLLIQFCVFSYQSNDSNLILGLNLRRSKRNKPNHVETMTNGSMESKENRPPRKRQINRIDPNAGVEFIGKNNEQIEDELKV